MTEQPAATDNTDAIAEAVDQASEDGGSVVLDNAGQPTDPFTPLDELPAAPTDPEENHVDAREQADEYTGEPDDLPRDVDGAQDDGE